MEVLKATDKKRIEKLHAPTATASAKPPASKAFFGDAIKKMTDDQIITPFTRDKLLGLLESGVKRDYGKFKKHFHDLLELHETLDEDV